MHGGGFPENSTLIVNLWFHFINNHVKSASITVAEDKLPHMQFKTFEMFVPIPASYTFGTITYL